MRIGVCLRLWVDVCYSCCWGPKSIYSHTVGPFHDGSNTWGKDISEDGRVEVKCVNQRVETTELNSFSCKNTNLLSIMCFSRVHVRISWPASLFHNLSTDTLLQIDG